MHLGCHDKEFLFDVLFKSFDVVDDTLEVELFLNFTDPLVDFVYHISMCFEFIELPFDVLDFFEGGIGSHQLCKYFGDLLSVKFAFLLCRVEHVTNFYLLFQFFLISFHGI